MSQYLTSNLDAWCQLYSQNLRINYPNCVRRFYEIFANFSVKSDSKKILFSFSGKKPHLATFKEPDDESKNMFGNGHKFAPNMLETLPMLLRQCLLVTAHMVQVLTILLWQNLLITSHMLQKLNILLWCVVVPDGHAKHAEDVDHPAVVIQEM